MKILVIGLGYVGLANAILLAQDHEVVGVDISEDKLSKLRNKISPLEDKDIKHFLENKILNIRFTNKYHEEIADSDFVILSLPTNFDESRGAFDTDILEGIIARIYEFNSRLQIVIKSTVPVGFTKSMKNKYTGLKIFFVPEFLREGSALHDNLYPSRIIVGSNNKKAKNFAKIMANSAKSNDFEIVYTNSEEAEAIKLFSNSYLAMRVAFFNELDGFSMQNKLDTQAIIHGVCSDPRIGENYNNPSFGYGGYCLPKDTKQLEKSFDTTPMSIIPAISRSNEKRKSFIIETIIRKNPEWIGIYRLSMKAESDNSRESAAISIAMKLLELGRNVIIYEPNIEMDTYNKIAVIKDIGEFKDRSDIILANRLSKDLLDVQKKVFSRDIYGTS